MLSILRKHVGWGIKVILGIVIVTFVFFFGYTTIRQQSQESTAVKVGKEEIPFSWYQFFYSNQYERFREKFKEAEMPEFILTSIRQTSERMVVQRALTRQFAKSLGLDITDRELAQFIMKEKNFDPVSYKNFLQYFYRQNGFSYENLVREDLLIQKFQEWGQTSEPLAQVQSTSERSSREGEAPTAKPLEGATQAPIIEMVYLPRVSLLDLWFQNFAEKTNIQSFVPKEQ